MIYPQLKVSSQAAPSLAVVAKVTDIHFNPSCRRPLTQFGGLFVIKQNVIYVTNGILNFNFTLTFADAYRGHPVVEKAVAVCLTLIRKQGQFEYSWWTTIPPFGKLCAGHCKPIPTSK